VIFLAPIVLGIFLLEHLVKKTMNCNNEYALQTTKGQTSFDETTLIKLRNLTKGKKLKL
jgi:hypothetical protein